jgi:hypothetical protein
MDIELIKSKIDHPEFQFCDEVIDMESRFKEFPFDIEIDLKGVYHTFGYIPINTNIKYKYELLQMIGENEIELIYDTKGDIYFISIRDYPPHLWYKFDNVDTFLENLKILTLYYNQTEYSNTFEKRIRAFLGTPKILSQTFQDIENHLIMDTSTEGLAFGSKWIDYPYRDELMNDTIDQQQFVIMQQSAMEDSDEYVPCFRIRSQYSKSIISVENYGGIFIFDIKYNPIKTEQNEILNQSLNRNFPNDMPVDVINSIMDYPFITAETLLEDNKTVDGIRIAALIASTPNDFKIIRPKLEDLLTHEDDTIKSCAKEILDLSSDKSLNTIGE